MDIIINELLTEWGLTTATATLLVLVVAVIGIWKR